MKILFEHPCLLPVKDYGGTERLIYWLMKELASRGHDVYFIGLEGSKVDDIGVNLIHHNKADWRALIPKDVDLIHLFYSPDFEIDYPTLVTMGCNGQPGEEFHENTVFVSKSNAQNHGCESFVHNCIDLDEYPYEKRNQLNWDNFMFLAKASWRVKNLKGCVRACKATGKHLHIAGGNYLLPSRLIHSYGMVSQSQKREIFRKVDGLLFPIRWHEPFGIAVIEMMSQGLPVLASAYGSMPEIIVEGTGHICQNQQELENKLASSHHHFDQKFIRDYVEKNFSVQVFADQYLQFYERILAGEKINAQRPKSLFKDRPEALLPF